MSDRLLGKRFTKEVLSEKYHRTRNPFTYVIISDTIGRNLDRWYCHTRRYTRDEGGMKYNVHFLLVKELATEHCEGDSLWNIKLLF